MSSENSASVRNIEGQYGDGRVGRVLTFVSPKGGTGKTVLTATAAYLLLKAGKRVVTIDADFSTRGLSLYLLGRILETTDLDIQKENCLAEAVLGNIPVDEIVPRQVTRENLQFNIILSNQNLWRGGMPDEEFLFGFSDKDSDKDDSDKDKKSTSVEAYFRFLKDLCDVLRCKFDYIIIDTRGGYDYSSALPAIIADGYVVVLEADKVSVEQVGAFKESIEAYGKTMNIKPRLQGFIVNKAIFSVDEKIFPEELARLYQGRTFGTIPLDRDCIRAYQVKDIAVERFPYSDFAYYSLQAIEQLVSPAHNWTEGDQKQFARVRAEIKSQWAGRHRVERIQSWLPAVQVLLVAIATTCYLLYKFGWGGATLTLFYVSIATFCLWSIYGSILSVLQLLRRKEVHKYARLSVIGACTMIWFGLVGIAVFDLPKTFSRDVLFTRIAFQEAILSTLEKRSDESRIGLAKATAESKFMKKDIETLKRKLQKTLEALAQPGSSLLAWRKFSEHDYGPGKIPNGYQCEKSSDCLPSPKKGHCYPGPPNNEIKYCIDRDSNCALPGTAGTLYGTTIIVEGRTFDCFQPTSGSARWRAIK